VVLVSEVLDGGGATLGGAGGTEGTEVVEEVLEDLVEGIRRFFRVKARGWVVDDATPEIEW
jgi:hypothetical protein